MEYLTIIVSSFFNIGHQEYGPNIISKYNGRRSSLTESSLIHYSHYTGCIWRFHTSQIATKICLLSSFHREVQQGYICSLQFRSSWSTMPSWYSLCEQLSIKFWQSSKKAENVMYKSWLWKQKYIITTTNNRFFQGLFSRSFLVSSTTM